MTLKAHLMNRQLPKIIFFQIKKANDKLLSITKTAATHFENKKQIIFLVENETSLKYLDELLWKEPKFSFLPHTISDLPSEDYVVLSYNKTNINKAPYTFNLTPEPLIDVHCNAIYEFDDQTDKNRASITKKKFKFYKDLGLVIESR